MGKLADLWKKAKDGCEKAWKVAQKAGKASKDFPKFKSDFQKNLDEFESIYDLINKLRIKLKEQEKLLEKSGVNCQKIISEYQDAIKKTDDAFTGPTTRGECQGDMKEQLGRIEKSIEVMLKG